ncbi:MULTISPECIES: ATP-binding cassette domain-containing protein [Arthrobacter]|uniref:ATP-binding cassette domain-containing protein n=2 Tax=Arthrobacter TaxID=1663 RepID=A0ABU9KP69_9MICC|nr:ATP-binding cassette domain-containing protein [Arthrobacter sp. YJM1]MDP5227307.1 ATP-binding cassette domain-containing protein [Arthrobacter sp. YJM1]
MQSQTATRHTFTHDHLAVDGVSQSYAGRRVLSDIGFAVPPGQRAGLIGENGSGKSTLLRILAGVQDADTGLVFRPARLGYYAQELDATPDTTAAEVLDRAQAPALEALAGLESGDPERYAQAIDDAERLGAWSAGARRGAALAGLGLSGLDEHARVGGLSGGQRARLALAALILEEPDALLLDEPSNHLDDAAVAYLESVLRDWKGPVLFASHDRTFLDRVATRIVDLDPLPVPAAVLADAQEGADAGSGFGVRSFGGGYSDARRTREHLMRLWRDRYEAEQEELADLRHEIEVGSRNVNRRNEPRTEARASLKFYTDKDARVTARRARNARVRFETLERDRVRRPPRPLRFAGFTLPPVSPAASRDGSVPGTDPVLRVTGLHVPGRLDAVDLALPPGGRLLLTGPNGSGKSTLLGALTGAVAHHGDVRWAPGTRAARLAQDTVFPEPRRTAAEWYARAVGPDRAEELPLAELGLLASQDVDRAVGELSLGLQRRVALAALVADPPDVLLLDEPSNHLSLALVDQLEEALEAFAGAVVIATHDRWLRSRWVGKGTTELRLGE